VSQEDESALQRFNAEVAKYNRLASKARHLMAESNELVDPYNALLARVRQQTAQTSSLIDAYNKKLEQYGH
jgi:ABC-type transporter Mla subunit MlaD